MVFAAIDIAQRSTSRFVLSRPRLLMMLLIIDIAYVINAMDRQVFPILLKSIRADLHLTPSQFGLLSTVFTLGMGLAAVPAGYFADRLGRKAVMQLGLFIFSLGTGLQGLAIGFSDLLMYRILSGFGEGAQAAALYTAVGLLFREQKTFAVGTLNASYGVGAFLGPVLGTYLAQLTGTWRDPLLVFGGLGAGIFTLVLIGIPSGAVDNIPELPQTPASTNSNEPKLFNRNVICCMIVIAVAGFAVYGYLGLYPLFLQEVLHFTPAQTGLVSGALGVGALASIPMGLVADRWDQKRLNMIGLTGFMATGAIMFGVPLGVFPQVALTMLVGVFFTATIYTNTNTLIQRSAPPGQVGTAVGLMVACMYIPASIAGFVFTNLAVAYGWTTAALLQLVAIPCIGLVAMFFVATPAHNSIVRS